MNTSNALLFVGLLCIVSLCLCQTSVSTTNTGNVAGSKVNATLKARLFGSGGGASSGLYGSILQLQLLNQLGNSGSSQNISSTCLLLLSSLLQPNSQYGGNHQGNGAILNLLPLLLGGNNLDISTLFQYGFFNTGQYGSLQNILPLIQLLSQYCGSTSNLSSISPNLLLQLLYSQSYNGNSNQCNLPCCTAFNSYQCRNCGPGYDPCYNPFGGNQNPLSGFKPKPSGSNNLPQLVGK